MTSGKIKFPPRPRSIKARKEQAGAVNEELTKAYPDARCALNYDSAFQLLIATVLSAQTTDVRVNSVTPELFETFPSPRDLAEAELAQVEDIIRPLGFFRSKAKSLVGIGNALVEDCDGKVPDSLEELVKLPGVGRKTANVVLGNAFGVPGITVDTHVGRLARRLGWSRETDPVKVESDIAQLLPESEWTMACHRLIFHGRQVCHSRKPDCDSCVVSELCPSFPMN